VDFGTDLEVTFQDMLIQLNQDLPINLFLLKSRLVLRKLHGTHAVTAESGGEVGVHKGRLTHFSTIYFMQISLPNT